MTVKFESAKHKGYSWYIFSIYYQKRDHLLKFEKKNQDLILKAKND